MWSPSEISMALIKRYWKWEKKTFLTSETMKKKGKQIRYRKVVCRGSENEEKGKVENVVSEVGTME